MKVGEIESMDLNIYNESCYDIIYNWAEIVDQEMNTIDQYIKNNNLKIITIQFPS